MTFWAEEEEQEIQGGQSERLIPGKSGSTF
jgi:hypothetical protein